MAPFLLPLPAMTPIELAERLAACEEAFRRAQRGNDADEYRRALVALQEAEAMAEVLLSEPTPPAER